MHFEKLKSTEGGNTRTLNRSVKGQNMNDELSTAHFPLYGISSKTLEL